MLTEKQLQEIRERWADGYAPPGRRIAQAERDIPALLETIEALRVTCQSACSLLYDECKELGRAATLDAVR